MAQSTAESGKTTDTTVRESMSFPMEQSMKDNGKTTSSTVLVSSLTATDASGKVSSEAVSLKANDRLSW